MTTKSIKSIVIISFSLLFLLYLGGCAKTKQEMVDAGMKTMTTEELKSLFSEKKIAKSHHIKKDWWFTVTYLPDGSVSSLNKKGDTYPGTYSIENDMFCSKMDFRKGTVYCSSWIKVDDHTYNVYESTKGSLVAVVSFQ